MDAPGRLLHVEAQRLADVAIDTRPGASQIERHAPFGGVVPDIAARMHAEAIGPVAEQAFAEAGRAPAQVQAVARGVLRHEHELSDALCGQGSRLGHDVVLGAAAVPEPCATRVGPVLPSGPVNDPADTKRSGPSHRFRALAARAVVVIGVVIGGWPLKLPIP